MIKFRDFVTVEFKEALSAVCEFKGFNEEERLHVYRFTNKYNEESKVFGERYSQLTKEQEEKQKEVKEGESKEEELKKINDEFATKLEQLLDCSAELKELDYNKIKKAEISPMHLFKLEKVLSGFPKD